MSDGYRAKNILVLLFLLLVVPRAVLLLATSATQRKEILLFEIKNRGKTAITLAVNVSWWEYAFGPRNSDDNDQTPDGHNSSLTNATISFDKNESRGSCVHQPNQPLSKISVPIAEENQEGAGKRRIKKAICEYISHGTQVHFPHFMQQVYRCYSLWMDHPEAQAILIAPDEKIQLQFYKKKFSQGVLHIFHEQMNMSTIVKDTIPAEKMNKYKTSKNYVFQEFNSEKNYDIKYVTALHRMADRKHNFGDKSEVTCREKKPRIGILNRHNESGRSMLNAEYIAGLQDFRELSRNNTVEVKYFDGLEFKDQIAFFRSVDILLSPHGAQLTGVAFMNAPCAHLLELFPKGYKLAEYFGSLALRSHKEYSYIYMSANSSRFDQAKTRKERYAARALNMCPSTTLIVDTMHKLVDEWQQCCESRNHQETEMAGSLPT